MSFKSMRTYGVKDIFGPTIQGEGFHTGRPVKFLRFAGCNRWSGLLKDQPQSICSFCDTDFVGGQSLTARSILEILEKIPGPRRLVISGGEPSLQLDVELLEKLKNKNYEIYVETNGSKDLSELSPHLDHITVSPKQSLEETKIQKAHDLKLLFPFLTKDISARGFEKFKAQNRYVQPIWNEHYGHNLKGAIKFVYTHPQWKLSLQTHKLIGVA